MAGIGPGGANDFPTEIQAPIDFTLDGSTQPPGYVPTVLLSSSSVPGVPRELVHGDATDRGLPPDEVRNRTTQTNPIGFVRAAEAPPDDSLEIDFGAGSWFAFWRHPFVRRTVVTLGLGAVIGVPPAVLGVLWARYYRAPPSVATSVARPLSAASNPTLPAVEPRTVAPEGRPTAETRSDPAKAGPTNRGATLGVPTMAVTADLPARPSTRTGGAEIPGRSPRARPKAPALAVTTTLAADDGDRRSEASRSAPPTVTTEPPDKTILPPSGL